MQQLITHLQIIYDNVYRQNAFVCICSQIVPMLSYTESHCPPPPPPTPPSPHATLLPGQTLQLIT